MFLLFLLLISVAQNLHDIFIAVGIPAGSTLLVFFEIDNRERKCTGGGKIKSNDVMEKI